LEEIMLFLLVGEISSSLQAISANYFSLISSNLCMTFFAFIFVVVGAFKEEKAP